MQIKYILYLESKFNCLLANWNFFIKYEVCTTFLWKAYENLRKNLVTSKIIHIKYIAMWPLLRMIVCKLKKFFAFRTPRKECVLILNLNNPIFKNILYNIFLHVKEISVLWKFLIYTTLWAGSKAKLQEIQFTKVPITRVWRYYIILLNLT